MYKLNFNRSLIELLKRGFRFAQNDITYEENNIVYLIFNRNFNLLKSENSNSEFISRRKEIINELLEESYLLIYRVNKTATTGVKK